MKDLTDRDIIRMNKNIDGNGYTLTDDKVKFQKIYLEQIKEANMYLMSRNQDIFVSSYRDGREYNPLTNISTVFRENLLYNYTSVDVVSANAQFTDVIIGSNVGLNVYQNLMDRFNITRSDAKVKYNATLNNNKKTENQAMNLYMNCGYDFKQASHLATLTAGSLKGSYFRMMANAEDRIINSYKKEYFDPFARGKNCGKEISIENNNDTILTTIRQLNYFRWAINNGVIEYVKQNVDAIYEDMNLRGRNALKSSSDVKKRQISVSARKKL